MNCTVLCLLSDPSHLNIIKTNLHDLIDWQRLGHEIQMDDSFLDSIERDKGSDTAKCKVAMLLAWLQSGRATKSSLVTALGIIGEDAIAARFE